MALMWNYTFSQFIKNRLLINFISYFFIRSWSMCTDGLPWNGWKHKWARRGGRLGGLCSGFQPCTWGIGISGRIGLSVSSNQSTRNFWWVRKTSCLSSKFTSYFVLVVMICNFEPFCHLECHVIDVNSKEMCSRKCSHRKLTFTQESTQRHSSLRPCL